MIEGFERHALVIVNLVSPREKFFGLLLSLSPAGLTMRGINLDSFDDWIRQVVRAEEVNIDLITMFIPLFRVERIFLDEAQGSIPSYGRRFEEVVGMPLQRHLGLDRERAG
jgi:hypothetical protein